MYATFVVPTMFVLPVLAIGSTGTCWIALESDMGILVCFAGLVLVSLLHCY